MDYEKLKVELKEIAEVAASVPEPFREKCFEILLQHLLLGSVSPPEAGASKVEDPSSTGESETLATTKIPVQAQLRVFMQRTGVTLQQLERLVLVDGTDVHFVHEPAHGTVAKGQMEWALLLALKQAIQANEFSTDPEDVRSICQEKGFYDKANFAAIFKRQPYATYFKQPLQPQGSRQTLSTEGQTALAELIKALGQKPE